MGQPQDDDEIVSKGEFAARSKVSAGRVTQWIAEGKISPNALVGEGRSAKIRVRQAQADLKRNLDPNQMTANGVRTRIPGGPLVPPASDSPDPTQPKPEPDTTELDHEDGTSAHDLAAERAALTRQQRINWELRNRERRGELIDAAEAERRWAEEIVALRSVMLAVAGELPLKLPHLTTHDVDLIDRAYRDAMDRAAGGCA